MGSTKRKKKSARDDRSGVDLSLPADLSFEEQEAINASYEWAARELEAAGYLAQAARMRARKKKLSPRYRRGLSAS